MSHSTPPPATKAHSWNDRKKVGDWKTNPGPVIIRNMLLSASSIHRGAEANVEAFYTDALQLKKLYPQYGRFINRAMTTIYEPASKHILDRIEWLIEKNADPSDYYKIPLKN